jgi:hypothetical protein
VVGDVLGGEAVGEGGDEFAHAGEGLGVQADAAGQQRKAFRAAGGGGLVAGGLDHDLDVV